ncbi:unnamed protein product [Vitrella brassicaformis CCMP3155]|uniref:Uncharacterized protein n=2 Tax=Vitrella brassicaformis TaxID=1169539 RepID=A0A0G4EK08_VITBC|nr:unnamed protein product [Vitrella brassicaformis CCMP3155]|eukprot:CEL97765.1 unnamed protein product [Vitrella brassicaformis CCMP3155]
MFSKAFLFFLTVLSTLFILTSSLTFPDDGRLKKSKKKGRCAPGAGNLGINYDAIKDARPYAKREKQAGEMITFHHVIPKSLLVKWWNKAVCPKEGQEAIRKFVDVLAEHAPNYSGFVENRATPADVQEWKDFMKDPSDNLELNVRAKLRVAVTWMPGNVVKGPPPGRRTEDPGSDFDYGVCWYQSCVHGQPLCPAAIEANRLMRQYVETGDVSLLPRTVELFSLIASKEGDGAPFYNQLWTHRGKKWTAGSDETMKPLYSADPAAYCRKLQAMEANQTTTVTVKFEGEYDEFEDEESDGEEEWEEEEEEE